MHERRMNFTCRAGQFRWCKSDNFNCAASRVAAIFAAGPAHAALTRIGISAVRNDQ